ncbi:MAG: FAD binding domain-containing protein [Spirochaetales bacterium]|nr:FAD binding domain-containing protein [Spirochaetales bacterium]
MAADIEWFFPHELAEVPSLLGQEGVIPHGGGTGILRGGMSQLRGLVDIGRLGLSEIRKNGSRASIGAAASYAAVAAAVSSWNPRHVLAQSLNAAATTPLRNRITVGGSIALFPYWSDLVGPLLALEAEVHLVGAREGWLPLPEYLSRREVRRGSLISEVRWQEESWTGEYRRWGRTRTDRPAFSLVVLGKRYRNTLRDPRIVLVGCAGRYRRLAEVEEAVAAGEGPAAGAANAQIEIPARMGFSGEYLSHCARVELERALSAVQADGVAGAESGR